MQRRPYKEEFSSCSKCSGGSKYSYSLGPLDGSSIAQFINCLRLNPRKFNLALLLLQTPCHRARNISFVKTNQGRVPARGKELAWKGWRRAEFLIPK